MLERLRRRRGRVDDDTGDRGGRRSRGAGAARRGTHAVANFIVTVTSLIALLIMIGVLLVVLEANTDNSIVSAVLDAGKWLVGPFDDVFEPKNRKVRILVNWGIAAALWLIAGRLLARLLRARL